ncbi:unnamed protein product [Adineta steineri]|uniref:GHMP kinase N-terminal domain-containing protein n=1 Tax=Adineta steineri TaxID=433720 RepID=A0A815CGF7_9BILA|nr:unnamed protein product [Adineta steineri]CAF3862816.1 unnamed protein product [Adineta steineri]
MIRAAHVVLDCFFTSYHRRLLKRTKTNTISNCAMFLYAPCKSNLTLDVFDKKERTDDYHNLDSLVVLFGEPVDELRIYIKPVIAYRAASAYLAHIDKPFLIKIDLYKRIPAEAGLGGGSSDAAAVLCALNTYFNQAIDRTILMTIAAHLGSDCICSAPYQTYDKQCVVCKCNSTKGLECRENSGSKTCQCLSDN